MINVTAAKLALTVGTLGAAYLTYNQIPENKYRYKLRKVFTTGELFVFRNDLFRALTQSITKGDIKGTKVLPKIHRVYYEDKKYVLVFSIPFGLNPDNVIKNKWLFEQQFGTNIDIQRDNKRFILTVFTDKTPSVVPYSYADILPVIENMRLPIVVGQREREFVAYDMIPDPNLIISGEPGSGKSTQLRAILSTLILYVPDNRLVMYLGDLKRSEFHLFRRIKHVKDVAVDTKGIYRMLVKVEKEMKERTELLDLWEVTHIDQYNKEAKDKKPYVLVAIDEVALLKKEKKIMGIIEEISTIGRALGIYLILSQQRADADVMDGKIKNNVTTRMAFRHADDYNSWITLGKGNSHASTISINEKGRMAFKHETIEYVQGPFLTEEEAKKLLEPLKVPRDNVKDMGEVTPEQPEQILGVLDDETTR